jgi:hypothetical protein
MIVDDMIGCFLQLCSIWSISYLLTAGASKDYSLALLAKADDGAAEAGAAAPNR